MRLVRGDVTALRAAGIGSGFRLVLDTGTFHDLKRTQRGAMGGRSCGCRVRCNCVAARVATAQTPAHSWREPRRGRGGVSRMASDARGAVVLSAAQDP